MQTELLRIEILAELNFTGLENIILVNASHQLVDGVSIPFRG
jgi:hypothetical protein